MSDRIPESLAAPRSTEILVGDPEELLEVGGVRAKRKEFQKFAAALDAAAPQEPLASAPRLDDLIAKYGDAAMAAATRGDAVSLWKARAKLDAAIAELEAGLREARSMFEATEELRAKETVEIARLTERNALLANALTDAQSALRSKDIQITALRSALSKRDAVIEAARGVLDGYQTVRHPKGGCPCSLCQLHRAICALTPSTPE